MLVLQLLLPLDLLVVVLVEESAAVVEFGLLSGLQGAGPEASAAVLSVEGAESAEAACSMDSFSFFPFADTSANLLI